MYIAALAQGDPYLQSTWSGTPARILQALEKMGNGVLAIDASPRRHSLLASRGLYLARQTKTHRSKTAKVVRKALQSDRSDYRWSDCTRDASILRARRQIRDASRPIDATIQFTSMSLGAKFKWPGINVAYIDSTFETLSTYRETLHELPRGLFEEVSNRERVGLEGLDHVFTASKYVRRLLLAQTSLTADKITATGFGLSRSVPFRERDHTAPFRGLFVARHSFRRKGGHLAVESFQHIRGEDPNATLTLVSDDLAAREAASNVPGVQVASNAAGSARMEELYAKSNALLMPALDEPLGLVYAEAMAAGLIVVGLNRNLLGDFEDGVAVRVPEPDSRAIAEETLRVFGNSSERESYVSAGRRFAQGCSWSAVAAQIDGTLRKYAL